MSIISADPVSPAEPVSRGRSTPVAAAPSPLRGPLRLVGSIWLTVVILFVLVVIMLWGTIVANKYGDTAAKFGIYGSWWFNALGFLLGIEFGRARWFCAGPGSGNNSVSPSRTWD